MKQAVIVSTARTGLAKSVRGSFNDTHGAVMGGHAVKHAIARAGIDAGEVEDVVMGCGFPEGATGNNIARESAIWAGCPVSTAGITVNRYCSSGLNAIAFAAQAIMTGGAEVMVGAGVESISLVQMGGVNLKYFTEEHLLQVKPALWMTMIETAEIVAQRYGISRTRQDEYALQSQLRTAAAQGAGKFADEIVPLAAKMKKIDKASGVENQIGVTVTHDECNRPDTTLEDLAALCPVHAGGQKIAEGKFVTAGNAACAPMFSIAPAALYGCPRSRNSEDRSAPWPANDVVKAAVPMLPNTPSALRNPTSGAANAATVPAAATGSPYSVN